MSKPISMASVMSPSQPVTAKRASYSGSAQT